VVFEHVIDALVHGSGYERIATRGCSDRTIGRRLKEWAAAGTGERLHAQALRAYDLVIGLELGDIPVDGCITKAPCGGERAGPSPVDRRKGGLKRSVASDGHGIPLASVRAGEPARLTTARERHRSGRSRALAIGPGPPQVPGTVRHSGREARWTS
jgi:hypothetical protein